MTAPSISDAILGAAMDAFLAEEYAQVSVAAIADRAHVAVGSIYHHFGDKEGLHVATAKRVMDIMLDEYLAPPLDTDDSAARRVMEHCLAYVRFVEERPAEYALVTSVSHDSAGSDHAGRFSEQLTSRVGVHLGRLVDLAVEGQEAGVLRRGDPGTMVMLTWSSLYGLCMLNRRYPGPIQRTTGRSALSQMVEQVVGAAMYAEAMPAG